MGLFFIQAVDVVIIENPHFSILTLTFRPRDMQSFLFRFLGLCENFLHVVVHTLQTPIVPVWDDHNSYPYYKYQRLPTQTVFFWHFGPPSNYYLLLSI
jgi:hypothetical protein